MTEPRKSRLYRERALARLGSLDELDKLVTVTRPRAWLALGAIGLLLATVLVWSMAGRLTTYVEGSGILMRGGSSMRVVCVDAGRVEEMLVQVGDTVTVGQAVTKLYQPVLEEDVKARTADVVRLRERADRLGTEDAADALAEAQAALEAALAQREARSVVRSSYAGDVASLQVHPGQFIAAGSPVITVEPMGLPLVATLYVPPGIGKKMEPGMRVQLIPDTMSADEYGYLVGRVTFVAEFPSTPEGMMAELQNEFLVKEFSASGAPLRVEVALQEQAANPSGYQWTSSQGPPGAISSGTVCGARVVLSSALPITRFFPSLSRLLGRGG